MDMELLLHVALDVELVLHIALAVELLFHLNAHLLLTLLVTLQTVLAVAVLLPVYTLPLFSNIVIIPLLPRGHFLPLMLILMNCQS